MKRVKEIMKERENWVEVTSNMIVKKAFTKLENHVEEHQMEFWDQLYIKVPEAFLEESIKETLGEMKQSEVLHQYPKLIEEVEKETLRKLAENLGEYGWKIGKKQREIVLGDMDNTTIKGIGSDLKDKKTPFVLQKFFQKKKKEDSIKQIEMKEEVNEESIE